MPSRFGWRAEIGLVLGIVVLAALFAYMQKPHHDFCEEISHRFYLQTHQQGAE